MSNRRTFLHRTRRAAFSWSATLAFLWGSLACASQRVEIDVMVAFDCLALKGANQSPEEMAQIAVQNLNQVLVRSKLDDQMHFRLVKTLHLENFENGIAVRQRDFFQSYARSRGVSVEQLLQNPQLIVQDQEACERLINAESNGYEEDYNKGVSGTIPGLSQARDEAKADLVLLSVNYVPLSLWGQGRGFLQAFECMSNIGAAPSLSPTFLSDRHYMAEFHAACTIQPQNGNDVFSHETMHVLGCGHADRQKTGPGPFYYADSTGYFSPDAKYSTIMCYNAANEKQPLPNVPMVPGDSRCINGLSGPYNPKLMGADAQLTDLPDLLGDKMHNNRETALRNAAVVACFRIGGNEKVLNERKEDALSMPPMVNRKTFLSPILCNVHEATQEEAAQAMAPTVPGMDREDAYTSTVFGTNAPARRSSGKLDGGTGKVVWYKVEVPEDGKCRVGVRPFGTAPGLNPVVAVWNEAGQAMQGKVFTGQAAAAEGYLYAVEIEAAKGMQLNVAVDSGNADGGQFSLVSQLRPGPVSVTAPPREPNPTGSSETGPRHCGNRGVNGGYGAVDLMLLILAFAGGAGLMWLIVTGRKIAAAPGVPGVAVGGPMVPPAQPYGGGGRQTITKEPARRGARIAMSCVFPDGSTHAYDISLNDIVMRHNFYIGRNSTADLRIVETSISGRHAVLKVRKLDGGQSVLLVGDAGSTNGTWIDGKHLTGDNCAKVKNGSHLVLGKVRATISIHS